MSYCIFVSIIISFHPRLHECFVTFMSPCYELLRPCLHVCLFFPIYVLFSFHLHFFSFILFSCRSDYIIIPIISMIHLHFCLVPFHLLFVLLHVHLHVCYSIFISIITLFCLWFHACMHACLYSCLIFNPCSLLGQ